MFVPDHQSNALLYLPNNHMANSFIDKKIEIFYLFIYNLEFSFFSPLLNTPMPLFPRKCPHSCSLGGIFSFFFSILYFLWYFIIFFSISWNLFLSSYSTL